MARAGPRCAERILEKKAGGVRTTRAGQEVDPSPESGTTARRAQALDVEGDLVEPGRAGVYAGFHEGPSNCLVRLGLQCRVGQ